MENKKSILELANDIRKEKGTYSVETDYSLRRAIQKKIKSIPYLKECYFIEKFITVYIDEYYEVGKHQFINVENNKDYYKEYYEGSEVLSDYNPYSDLIYVDMYKDIKQKIGNFNVCFNKETEEEININIKLELEKLGTIEDCFVLDRNCVGDLVKYAYGLEEYLYKYKPHEKTINTNLYFRELIGSVIKEKTKDWRVLSVLMELIDALIVLVEKDKEN